MVIRCQVCDAQAPKLYCDLCRVNLCTVCAGTHFLDESREHRIVSIMNRTFPNCPKCVTHTSKLCELRCEQCDIPICALCVSSQIHRAHDVTEIFDFFKSKKETIRKDLQELEKSIQLRYKEIASKIPLQKSYLIKNSQKLTTIIEKRGEVVHRAIDTIIRKMKSEIVELESKYLSILKEQEDEITNTISAITEKMAELRKLLHSSDVCLVSDYKSSHSEFRRLPPLLKFSLPTFSRNKINTDMLCKQIGSLSTPSMTTQERVDTESSGFSSREFLNVPRIIETVDTEDRFLFGVVCLSDERIWTIGQSNVMELRNLQGQLLESVKTKSGNVPEDIAVTKSGNLVYTDPIDKALKIVLSNEIQTVVRLKEWKPLKVCSTSDDDYLVIMLKEDHEQTKVERYCGSKKKQTIQFDERGQPLYSSKSPFSYTKCIIENRNQDICVTDNGARAVVVVNKTGKLRFTYTGFSSSTATIFDPIGITSDSQSRILITDWNNYIVHILDHDGQFLRYFDNCDLRFPFGICVDTRDNLFVAEHGMGKVKKIQYYK